jgi:hypothetical protein
MQANSFQVVAVIEQAGVRALRVAFTVAVIIVLLAGAFIWRKRHQLFDAIQTSRTISPSFGTVAWKQSCLSGVA